MENKDKLVTAEELKYVYDAIPSTEDKTFITGLKKIIDISDTEDISILSQCNESENGGGQLKIGNQCSNFYSYLNIISDGDGWEFYSKSIDNNYFLYVGASAVDLTKNTVYHFKEDGLYLNNSKVTFSGNYNDLSNKPTLFSGSYNDLTNKPTLFSGSYNDLTNKPTIPDTTGMLTTSNYATTLGSVYQAKGNYVEKITPTVAAVVYAASKSDSTVTSYQLTSAATGSTAMFRDGSGRTKVATPSADGDAANKSYVDGKVGSYKITSYTVDDTAGTISLVVEAV